jgi:hypothetical protein
MSPASNPPVDADLERLFQLHDRHPKEISIIQQICQKYIALGNVDELLPWTRKAFELAPFDPEFTVLHIQVLCLLADHQAALEILSHSQLSQSNPLFYHFYLGQCLVGVGDIQEGCANLQHAHQLTSMDPASYSNITLELAKAFLLAGDPEGFRHYLIRNASDAFSYQIPGLPFWTGSEDLCQKRLLITNQLGFGDQFLLFSCIQYWLEVYPGISIMVCCAAEVFELLKTSLPNVKCIAAHGPIGNYAPPNEPLMREIQAFAPDFQITLLHLPMLAVHHRIPLGSFFRPYLRPSPSAQERAKAWAVTERQTYPKHLFVGIFWNCLSSGFEAAGAIARIWARLRSLPDEAFQQLIDHPQLLQRIRLINLQLALPPHAQSAVAQNALGIYPPLESGSFDDTAACIQELDLVISADSSVANLSAMLGKPTWVFVHQGCDWRWGSSQDHQSSKWLPDVQVFRQTQTHNWTDVMDALISRLHSCT